MDCVSVNAVSVYYTNEDETEDIPAAEVGERIRRDPAEVKAATMLQRHFRGFLCQRRTRALRRGFWMRHAQASRSESYVPGPLIRCQGRAMATGAALTGGGQGHGGRTNKIPRQKTNPPP